MIGNKVILIALLLLPGLMIGQEAKKHEIHKSSSALLEKAHWEFIKAYKFSAQGEMKQGDSSWTSLEEFVQSIRHAVTLEEQNIILAGAYGRMLLSGKLSEYEKIITTDTITAEPWRSIIDTLYNGLKGVDLDWLEKRKLPMFNLTEFQGDAILDEIMRHHKGRLVYVNFWAPWCIPCHRQFDYEKKLMDEYAASPVDFVYVANRSSEEAWALTVAKKQLKGHHYLINVDQFQELAQQLGFNSLPQYVLFGKRAELLKTNAPKPSEEKQVRQLFQEALTK